jgi:poly(A) polymerase
MEKTAIAIVKILRQAGHEAYFAGGCVRDILTRHEPQDYDIVTSAKPEEIESLLEHTIPIGKKFGVILAIRNNHHFEIATFRSDSGSSDGRRPDFVTYTSAKEDAWRRDFTINGMFYDPVGREIIDYVGGKNDLHENVIRFIGDPEQRIKEDHLRILRAIRFRNKLGFQYAPNLYQAIKENRRLVLKVSKERIRNELNKIILLKNVSQAFTDMEDLAILKLILPEVLAIKGVAQPLAYHLEGDVWNHTFKALASVSVKAPLVLRWAVLLHDIGKTDTFKVEADRIHFDGHCQLSGQMARKILSRLCFPNKFIQDVVWLVEHHMMMKPLKTMTKRRKIYWYKHFQFNNLLRLCRADIMGSNPRNFKLYREIRAEYLKFKHQKQIKPLIKGKDILHKFKIAPGPQIGKILAEIEHAHLEEKIHTKKEAYILAGKLLNNELRS